MNMALQDKMTPYTFAENFQMTLMPILLLLLMILLLGIAETTLLILEISTSIPPSKSVINAGWLKT
jgi:hypothetical protein